MTRYTKLEGRKKEFLPASNHFDTQQEDDAGAGAHQPVPAPVIEPKGVSAPAAPAIAGPPASEAQSQVHDDDLRETDVNKLMKRSKLLRLKAKKAKTPEKKRMLMKELRQLGQQIAALGSPKVNGKRKNNDEGETFGNKRVFSQEARAEYRRQKRAEERTASTRCFACRGQGHTAKDCPNALNASSAALESDATAGNGVTGSSVVGICFRCGSKDHTLAKCTLPGGGKGAARGGKNLPFATCFICGEKGHLSLACPQNKSRGVYPNGGSCRLCQSVDHLVKDCPLREQQAVSDPKLGASIADMPTAVGADEDDFHAFSRVRKEVDSEETKVQQQAKDLARRRAPPPTVKKPAPKKVVTF